MSSKLPMQCSVHEKCFYAKEYLAWCSCFVRRLHLLICAQLYLLKKTSHKYLHMGTGLNACMHNDLACMTTDLTDSRSIKAHAFPIIVNRTAISPAAIARIVLRNLTALVCMGLLDIVRAPRRLYTQYKMFVSKAAEKGLKRLLLTVRSMLTVLTGSHNSKENAYRAGPDT